MPTTATTTGLESYQRRVPPMVREVTGQRYGGAYWNDAEYTVILDQSETTGEFGLMLNDSAGAELATQVITPSQGGRLYEVVKNNLLSEPVVDGLDNLVRETVWSIGDDTTDDVRLGAHIVEEIGAWFGYALGDQVWDGDPNTTEWEY